MPRVLVTGATGFVGKVLCASLAGAGYIVRAALRSEGFESDAIAERVVVGDICADTNWRNALIDVDFVIHAAARAHVLHDSPQNTTLYFRTNVDGTRRLAEASALAGIRRFIFVSSIKVNGEETTGRAFTASDVPHPKDAYGESKLRAELALSEVGQGSRMPACIVRCPLVYGPGVRANFLHLLRAIDKGLPLPFGAIENNRSMVSIWNLCNFLVNLLENGAAPGRTWMVADGHDLSTPELIREIAAAMGRQARLIGVPVPVLKFLGAISGRTSEVARLCGSLQVDLTTTRRELRWEPPMTLREGLAGTADWYRKTHRAGVSGSA
jgi:nucleoside-diphosphate-sugar epimerase